MPMTFTDGMVIQRAKDYGIQINPQTTLRERVANHVESVDPVEAWEIRTGRPWNEMTGLEALTLIERIPAMMDNSGVVSRLGK